MIGNPVWATFTFFNLVLQEELSIECVCLLSVSGQRLLNEVTFDVDIWPND